MAKLKVTLAGAGGKMGLAPDPQPEDSEYEVSYLEISPQGMEKLRISEYSVIAGKLYS